MRYFEIQIPVAPNKVNAFNLRCTNGGNFSDGHNLDFDTFLLGLVGGMSKLPEIQGVWIANGEIYAEKMIPYRFATDDENYVTEIVEFAKKHYEQIAIFIAEIGTAQII
jgi:hypothetical protein